MNWLFQPLLLLIAKSTENQLARQIEYLKAENTILRKRLPKCVTLPEDEKRLLDTRKIGMPKSPNLAGFWMGSVRFGPSYHPTLRSWE